MRGLGCGDGDGSVYFSLATACARQGKQEEAAKYREMFSQRKAEQVSAGDTPFQIRYDAQLRKIALASICQAGTVYDRQGNPAEAERLLLRALALVPDNLTVCGELAAFYRRRGRIADAHAAQRRMVDIQPGNAVHYVNLASLATQLGDYPAAEAALRMGATAPGESLQMYRVLAAACRQLGDRAAAETALAKAQKLASAGARRPETDLPPGGAAIAPASKRRVEKP